MSDDDSTPWLLIAIIAVGAVCSIVLAGLLVVLLFVYPVGVTLTLRSIVGAVCSGSMVYYGWKDLRGRGPQFIVWDEQQQAWRNGPRERTKNS